MDCIGQLGDGEQVDCNGVGQLRILQHVLHGRLGEQAMRWTTHNKYEWKRWYAWYPVRFANTTVWLEYVERRWNPNANVTIIDPYDPGYPDGGWEYR